jgi:hypothetical protein
MAVRERFTDEEWRLVVHIPFDAFIFAAMADGNVEDTEVQAFVETLEKAPMIKNDLHREILLHHASSGAVGIGAEITFEMKESVAAMDERFARTKPILKQRLTATEYQEFFRSVFINALAVAGSSREKKKHAWSRKQPPISKKESDALAVFAMKWDIDISFLAQLAS